MVPAAQVDQGLIVARELLKNAVITPKACEVLADPVLTVTGVKGTLAATVVKTGAAGTVAASAAPELAKLVNAALAAN
ncbi:hypothetical protein ACFVTE_17140 [Arthrobacter sp. NPDC058097]|uniref:hypothetical protein n=1 Tax=Arthrobacter sp. NPDC058097 TaxID=3346340 RepID=UPI0036DC7F76